jgi:hypothetical protein
MIMSRFFLALFGLLLVSSAAGRLGAQAPRIIRPVGDWPAEVKGYGDTTDQARKSAIHEGIRQLRLVMQRQNPPLQSWDPDPEFVGAHWLILPGHAGEDFVDENLGLAKKSWIIRLKSDLDWQEVVSKDRQAARRQVAISRQGTLARAVLLVSLLLGIGFSYLRLEEWTQYRYSRVLRFFGAGLVAGIAGVAWWIAAA